MSEANKKIRDLERALRREKANVARAQSERDAALQELNKLRQSDLPLDIDAAFEQFIEFPEGSSGNLVTTVSAKLFAKHCVNSLAAHDAEVIDRFKNELLKSVTTIFRPHIEGVCEVVQKRISQQAKEVQL